MTFKIKGSDLGVMNCEFIASGETAEDIVDQMVKHLQSEHDISMPDEDVILEGEAGEWIEDEDSGAAIIVKRLREALDLDSATIADVADAPRPLVSENPSSG